MGVAQTPRSVPFAGEAELLAALGGARSVLPVACYDNGVAHVYVTLESRDAVAALRPDLTRLAAFPFGMHAIAGEQADLEDPHVSRPRAAWRNSPPGRSSRWRSISSATAASARDHPDGGRDRPDPRCCTRTCGGGADEPIVEVGGSAVIVARGEFRLQRGA